MGEIRGLRLHPAQIFRQKMSGKKIPEFGKLMADAVMRLALWVCYTAKPVANGLLLRLEADELKEDRILIFEPFVSRPFCQGVSLDSLSGSVVGGRLHLLVPSELFPLLVMLFLDGAATPFEFFPSSVRLFLRHSGPASFMCRSLGAGREQEQTAEREEPNEHVRRGGHALEGGRVGRSGRTGQLGFGSMPGNCFLCQELRTDSISWARRMRCGSCWGFGVRGAHAPKRRSVLAFTLAGCPCGGSAVDQRIDGGMGARSG